MFPELEDENERMKKAIMHVLYENYTDAAVIGGVEIAEIATWLEKQGEKDPCTNCINNNGYKTKLEFNESSSRIEVGCKIRSKTNPDVILSIVSDDCHGDKFECSNGSVLSLRQINKYYDLI